MSRPLRVLVVGDGETDPDLIRRRLEGDGSSVDLTRVRSSEEAVSELTGASWDLVVTADSPREVGTQNAAGVEYSEAQQQLQRIKGRTDLILDAAGEGIFGVDAEGLATFVNPAAASLLGHDPAGSIGAPVEELVGTEGVSPEASPIRRTLATGEVHSVTDATFRRRGGDPFPVEYVSSPIREDDEVTGAVVVFTDVTEQRQAEAAQRRLTTILEATTDLVAIADVDGTEATGMLLNPAGRRLLGLPDADTAGMASAPPDLISSLAPAEAVRAAARDGVWTGEFTVRTPSGPLPVSEVVVAHRDEALDVAYISVIARDLSDRKHFEAELSYLADHDALTGLFNRRRFRAELERQLDYSTRYGDRAAVLFLDLDNFKQVNDTYGHDAGNSVLRTVADLLRERLRSSDALARLGGDEFAILLPSTDADEVRAVSADIVRLVREQVAIGSGSTGSLTTSAGVVLVGEEEMSANEVLVHADRAMYEAKDAGRDTFVVFTPLEARRARARSREAWESRIRSALEEDRFVLHLQPIIDLESRHVAAYEALLRMVEEDGELVPPGAFLLAAERFGLIHAIDRMVVSRTTRLLASFPDSETRLEVNLSGRSVGNPEILSLIQSEVASQEVDPSRLVFEVTETAAIANMGLAAVFARDLGELGCRFALDDFGVGFGSFYYLKHLPLDFLKIDGEFIRNLPDRPEDQVMVRAMGEIASSLGKESIAEFVGDEATIELLSSYGVQLGQGFHIGVPVPVAQALAAMERRGVPDAGGSRRP